MVILEYSGVMRQEYKTIYNTIQKVGVTVKISLEDFTMMDFILSMLEKRLAKRQQEVIKLRWKKARLEQIKRENNNV